jgi:hypothetical protein
MDRVLRGSVFAIFWQRKQEHVYALHLKRTETKMKTIGIPGSTRQEPSAMNMAREMARQMQALCRADLKYPEEFDMPLHRLVRERYNA